MKPTVFCTKKGTYYLYSPSKKSFLPISHFLADEIVSNNSDINSDVYNILSSYGYFEDFSYDYNYEVDSKDIESAVSNISQVIFEVTSACNLRCAYCCYGHGYETFKNRVNGKLSFEIAKNVLDFLAKHSQSVYNTSYNTPFVISFYGGEPLLNISVIKEIVHYAKSLCIPNRFLRFSMTTNATHLYENIDFLKNENFCLLVSLDGDKYSNQYRLTPDGMNVFDIVMKNLELVREKYPEFFSTIRYNSVYTDKSNTDDLLNFFHEKFKKSPTFSALHKPDIDALEYHAVSKMMKSITPPSDIKQTSIEDLLQIPLHRRIVDIIQKLSKNYFFSEKEMDSDVQYSIYPTSTCVPFSKRMFVTTNGYILPCEKICRDIPFSTVVEHEVNMDFFSIAQSFNERVSKATQQCKHCYLQQCCNQCIHSFKKGVCTSFANQNSFASILSEAFSYMEDNPEIVTSLEKNVILR